MKTHHSEIAWHYTTGEKFRLIVNSGVLLPTPVGIGADEKPVLWFSKHPYYEPTARKAVIEEGVLRILPVPELFQRGGGLVRFGYPTALLHHGDVLQAEAGISSNDWCAMAANGKRQGGDAEDWWGSTGYVAVHSCIVEVMTKALQWQRVFTPSGVTEKVPGYYSVA